MDAREFALSRHGDQGWFILPFSQHLDRVASFFPEETAPLRREVAYLHDTLEDTETTFDELVALFGMPVAKNVQLLTKYPGLGMAHYYQAIYCHPDARAVKLADLEVNLSQFIVNLETLPRKNGWFRETEDKIQNYARYIVYLLTGSWSTPVRRSVIERHLMQPNWGHFHPPQAE